MKARYMPALLASILAILFARRRSYAGMAQTADWTSTAFGKNDPANRPWSWRGRLRQPKIRPERRRGPISRLFGLMWVLFWVWFGLSFVFGWGDQRQAVIGVANGFFSDAARWASALFSASGGMVQ